MPHPISGLHNLDNLTLNSILHQIDSSSLNSILFCDCIDEHISNEYISNEYLIIKISDH